MISFRDNPELMAIAPRIVWFEGPDDALRDPARFFAYALRYAVSDDMAIIRKFLTDDEFVELLDKIPPGIVDGRSWAYWNAVMHRYPAPPMPVRKIV